MRIREWIDLDLFGSLINMRWLFMVFGAIMPASVGFANRLIPTQIRAPDLAVVRMNGWSAWILPFAASLLAISFFAWRA